MSRRRRSPPPTRAAIASRTSPCWAPSWRLRSSRRRSASAAAAIRARDSRRRASWALRSAWRRSWSIASRAARWISSDETRVVEQVRPVQHDGDDRAVARQRRGARARARHGGQRAPARIDPAATLRGVDDLQLWIAERDRQQPAQSPGPGRRGELDDEPGELRARAPGPQTLPRHARGDAREARPPDRATARGQSDRWRGSRDLPRAGAPRPRTTR